MSGPFPEDSAARKTYPVNTGLFAYFPAALAKIARHSWEGNQKHNPGQPTHWARGKSDDHLDAAGRHLIEGDLVGLAWRALAALQLRCESEGAPIAPGAVIYMDPPKALDSVSMDPPSLAEVWAELHDEDAPTSGLKAGEAHEHDRAAYVAATAAQRPEGD